MYTKYEANLHHGLVEAVAGRFETNWLSGFREEVENAHPFTLHGKRAFCRTELNFAKIPKFVEPAQFKQT